MMWQDWVISVGQILFFVALLPSIFSAQKPALATSILSATVLTIFAFTFQSLDMEFSAIGTALGACGWWILTLQKWRRN